MSLCDPIDCSPPGSTAHGILQARMLEWVAMSFSRGSFWPGDWTHISCVSCIAGWFLACWAIREAHRLHRVHEWRKDQLWEKYLHRQKDSGWARMAMMEEMRNVWSQDTFWISLLNCPSPILFNSSNVQLFIPQIEKTTPKGKGLVQSHTVGPWQR